MRNLRGSSLSMDELFQVMVMRIAKWLNVRSYRTLNYMIFLYNWDSA